MVTVGRQVERRDGLMMSFKRSLAEQGAFEVLKWSTDVAAKYHTKKFQFRLLK